ncbi:putative NAD(P)-binding domain superfamily [Helianthus annuus]|nr:putative NAD(P)-binding domain superfamily [Helianthus annuus]KAJ0643358.1 putative NAD(P)-binding domain superfamily [Helianthus annuus]
MTEPQLRFGILGCANIARKVSRAMLLSPNTTISAIGSRSLEKAVAFASENHFPESAKVLCDEQRFGQLKSVLSALSIEFGR